MRALCIEYMTPWLHNLGNLIGSDSYESLTPTGYNASVGASATNRNRTSTIASAYTDGASPSVFATSDASFNPFENVRSRRVGSADTSSRSFHHLTGFKKDSRTVSSDAAPSPLRVEVKFARRASSESDEDSVSILGSDLSALSSVLDHIGEFASGRKTAPPRLGEGALGGDDEANCNGEMGMNEGMSRILAVRELLENLVAVSVLAASERDALYFRLIGSNGTWSVLGMHERILVIVVDFFIHRLILLEAHHYTRHGGRAKASSEYTQTDSSLSVSSFMTSA